jgi:hypothetical protein
VAFRLAGVDTPLLGDFEKQLSSYFRYFSPTMAHVTLRRRQLRSFPVVVLFLSAYENDGEFFLSTAIPLENSFPWLHPWNGILQQRSRFPDSAFNKLIHCKSSPFCTQTKNGKTTNIHGLSAYVGNWQRNRFSLAFGETEQDRELFFQQMKDEVYLTLPIEFASIIRAAPCLPPGPSRLWPSTREFLINPKAFLVSEQQEIVQNTEKSTDNLYPGFQRFTWETAATLSDAVLEDHVPGALWE